jgi:hypothetical protein
MAPGADRLPVPTHVQGPGVDEETSRTEEHLRREMAAMERLFEARLAALTATVSAQAEKVALALASADKALTKAETATEKRFEGQNEFRQQLSDQTATFITRRELETMRESWDERSNRVTDEVHELQRIGANMQGRLWALGAGVSVVVIVINVAIRFLG